MEMREQVLKVGETFDLKKGFITKVQFLYAGMTNQNTYSLVVIHTSGNAAWSYNIYLPVSRKQVEISKKKLQITRISPDEVYFYAP